MAPSVMAFILLAIFHVGHAVQEGDQGQPPGPPPDKMTAMSNLLATLKKGPGGRSPLQITLYSKVAMLELKEYAQTLVAQGNSVEAHPDVKEDVARAGEVAEDFVKRIEQSLSTEMKLYKMLAAQKMALDRAWAKINVKTSDPAQCLDLWCQGAKDVMDGLASDGSYAEATGCILVMKYLRRAIQELRTTQDQHPAVFHTTANFRENSEDIKKRMVRGLTDPPVVVLSGNPATTTGNTETPPEGTGVDYSGITSCGISITGFGVMHTFQASKTAIKVDTCESEFDTAIAVLRADGSCLVISDDDGYCSLQTVVTFPSTPGDTYSILVFGPEGQTGGYTLTVTEMPVEPICGSPVSGGISTSGKPGPTGTLAPLLGFVPVCGVGFRSDSYWASVVYSFEAAETGDIEMTLDCDQGTNTILAVFDADNECPYVTEWFLPLCGTSQSVSFPATAGDTYLVSVIEFFDSPFAFSLSISPEPAPCPTTLGSPAWCENIKPLEYSLSGKEKKKAIKECLKYEAILGDSALPKEIGQKIGLTSPGVFSLGAGVGLMAMVALTAVALKRRFAGSTWVPVPEEE